MQARIGQVVHVQELAPRRTAPPQHDLRGIGTTSLVEAADQRGQNVRAGRIEVVVRPVQIRRHRRDPGQAVLASHCLDLHDPGDLRDRVGVVRRLELTGQQTRLADRLLGVLRVDARRPEEQQPRRADLERRVHQVDLDAEVVAEELGRVVPVRQDAADPGRGVDHHGRPVLGQERERGRPIPQVQLGRRSADQVAEAGRFQAAPDRRADQAAVTRDVHRCTMVHQYAPAP